MSGTSRAPDLVQTLADHDRWTDALIPTVPAARADKKDRMAADPFAFLRATYVRWAQRVRQVAPDPPGPEVPAVGDLHVDNFGTWRDAESRLVWGVNDFDETDRLPAGYDLLRLTTSALLAAEHTDRLATSEAEVLDCVVDGYARAVGSGGGPLVLDRPDPPPLGPLLPDDHAATWWAALDKLPTEPVDGGLPAAARDLLLGSLPPHVDRVDLRARAAGMGSRDHLRIVAVARAVGGPVVREVKAMTPPATWWLDGRAGAPAVPASAELSGNPRRCPDPVLRYTDGWVVRRLAPWADRIELSGLQHHADAARLLRAMGAETADLHLAGASAAALADLTSPAGRAWLATAARRMLTDTRTDWQTWREHWRRHGHHDGRNG